jgi:hypothetical protein
MNTASKPGLHTQTDREICPGVGLLKKAATSQGSSSEFVPNFCTEPELKNRFHPPKKKNSRTGNSSELLTSALNSPRKITELNQKVSYGLKRWEAMAT